MRRLLIFGIVLLGCASASAQNLEEYLRWSKAQCESVGKSTMVSGRVGGMFAYRGLKTDQTINYKLKATWFTPDVLRASARCAQLTSRLSDEETRKLVGEAIAPDSTVVMIELDPREGSGVIPSDWEAFLQPKGRNSEAVHGVDAPNLRNMRALQGVVRKNYDYDRLWATFNIPPEVAEHLFVSEGTEVELIVRIRNQEGKVSWRIPDSMRTPAAH